MTKTYRVERSVETDRDIRAIYRFLVESYCGFGEPLDVAENHARNRIIDIEQSVLSLGRAPHQGTRRPDLLPDLRSVTKNRAILYFTVDDDQKQVRVLAIFFGGQDHQRAMLIRLGPQGP